MSTAMPTAAPAETTTQQPYVATTNGAEAATPNRSAEASALRRGIVVHPLYDGEVSSELVQKQR